MNRWTSTSSSSAPVRRGLPTAIRLKQHAAEQGRRGLGRRRRKGLRGRRPHPLRRGHRPDRPRPARCPEWREDPDRPLTTEVTEDEFLYLGPAGGVRLPNLFMPKLMNNHGNFIGSLGNVCRYLGRKAEELGVEIYPGLSGRRGADRRRGRGRRRRHRRHGHRPRRRAEGRASPAAWSCAAKYTIFAEGARGSLTKQLIDRFDLDQRPRPPEIRPRRQGALAGRSRRSIQPGLVQHSMGWPLPNHAGGGSWLYHFDDNLVSVGFVVHLNYENPTLSPFDEFQRFKTHPMIRDVFEGGKRIGYGGARHHGGRLAVGAAAGLPGRLPRRRLGGLRQRAAHQGQPQRHPVRHALRRARVRRRCRRAAPTTRSSSYEEAWRSSRDRPRPQARAQRQAALVAASAPLVGVALGGLDMWMNELFGWSLFGTHEARQAGLRDPEAARPRSSRSSTRSPDGVLTFDRLSSVFLSNTNHEEDQPSHLKVEDIEPAEALGARRLRRPARSATARPGSTSGSRTRPSEPRFVINAQNCVHCKTCDIKDPNQNINWVTPEGGGGPNYVGM